MLIVYQTKNINTPAISSSTIALVANPQRNAWAITNLGQNELYIRLGSDASTTVFHFVLKKGTANDDGTGGSVNQTSGVVYTGIITIAGTNPRYVVMEM